MELLQFLPFMAVFLLALLGIGSLALSLNVWRKRRHSLEERSPRARVLGRLAFVVGLAGGILIVLSLSLRTFFPRRGELFVRDSLVIRADPERGLPNLNASDDLDAGAVLVTFSRPGLETEIERLRLEDQRLAAEAARLRDTPIRLDPVLVREQQDLIAERRHLLQRRDLFRVELQRLEQQSRTDIISKKVQRHDIRVQLADYAGRIRRAQSEQKFERLRLASARGMRREDVISDINLAEHQRNIETLQADLDRLARETVDKKALLAELDRGIAVLEKTLSKHETLVGERTREVTDRLAELATLRKRLDARVAADQKRIAHARTAELEANRLRRAECAKELEKLEADAREFCPQAGRIHFRHPSPKSAMIGEPVVMFGPREAVRARFRLPAHEAEWLADSGRIDLLATSHEVLEERLVGRVVGRTEIAHEPGFVIAELECEAAPSQLQYLSRGLSLDARLLWMPPFFADPLLLMGALMAVLALIPSILWRFRRRRGPIAPVPRAHIEPPAKPARAQSV